MFLFVDFNDTPATNTPAPEAEGFSSDDDLEQSLCLVDLSTSSYPDLSSSPSLATPLSLDDSISLASPSPSLACRIASSPRPSTSSPRPLPASSPAPKRFREEWLQQTGEQVERDARNILIKMRQAEEKLRKWKKNVHQ